MDYGKIWKEIESLRINPPKSEREEALEDLIGHMWVHDNYENCGYRKMTTKQKQLYKQVIKKIGYSEMNDDEMWEELNSLHAELDFLRYFFDAAQDAFGPANSDVTLGIQEAYENETGNPIPDEYRYND